MKKIHKYCLIFLIAIGVHTSAFFIPYGNHTSIYAAVDKETDGLDQEKDWLSSSEVGAEPSEQFIIFKNKLYLRIQKDKSTIMAPVKEIDKWNINTLHHFRIQHPELEKYWPDKEATNLGVKWITN